MKSLLVGVAVCALVLFMGAPAYAQQTNQQVPSGPVNTNSSVAGQIPAGTELVIRTNDAIDATANNVGNSYSAEIARDIVGADGNVLVPQGSPAELTINKVGKTTPGVGSNQVSLALRSVTIGGNTYQVRTNTVEQSGNRGIGANRRTAEMTGGGALLGTVIGAVAGGGKGAAIGAVLGGGAGAAAQVLTAGNQVKVPAESVLTFKLDSPLQLQQ